MPITKYKILLLIHQNKRLGEIAQELGLSQPTVTFHLKSLEERLGIKLYHNKCKYLHLTEAAKNLLPYITQILDLEDNLLQKAKQYKHFQLGSLSLGATLAPSLSLLPEIVAHFTKTYPDLHISLETASTSRIIEGITKRKYDIGFISSNTPLPPFIVSKHFTHDELVLVYPYHLKSHFEAQSTTEILSQSNFIHHTDTSSTRQAVEQYLNDQGILVTSSITTTSTPVIKELIKKEIGISILPISLIQAELDASLFGFIPLDTPKLHKEVQLIYHENTYLSPIMETFINTTQLGRT